MIRESTKLGFDIEAGNVPGICIGSVDGSGKYLKPIDPKFLSNPCFISGLYIIDNLPNREMEQVYNSLTVSK